MANPKLYFKVIYFTHTTGKEVPVFTPVSSVCKELTAKFYDNEVINRNYAVQNDYTKKIAESDGHSGDIYVSDNYDYDPKLTTFVFEEIHKCENNDYIDLSEGKKIMFDVKASYSSKSSKPNNAAHSKNESSFLTSIIKEHPCPTPEDNDGFYVEDKNWMFLVRNILKKKNTMLVGPTGVGKTELVMNVCKSLGINCTTYDMGAMQDPLTDLLGSHRIENGNSIFDYAKFVSDVQKPGVIILDELSRAPLMANNILFPCLDSRRTLPIEIADSKNDRVVKVHPDCVFVATANIGAEYSGTNDIDEALMNRFFTLHLDYLPQDIEAKVLELKTNIDVETASNIVSVVSTIRKAYADGRLSQSISTRESISCAELYADGFDMMEAIEYGICQKYKIFDNNEYSIIKKIIMGF